MKPYNSYPIISLYSRGKQNISGFTLIELLVTLIILSILVAIALPNLLGQIGKARETEGKSSIGTFNRSQQGYHLEKTNFAEVNPNQLQSGNILGAFIPPSKYYAFTSAYVNTAGGDDTATIVAEGIDTAGVIDHGGDQGTRDHSGGIIFIKNDSRYGQQLCRADIIGLVGTAPSAINLSSVINDPVGTCPNDMKPIK